MKKNLGIQSYDSIPYPKKYISGFVLHAIYIFCQYKSPKQKEVIQTVRKHAIDPHCACFVCSKN